MRIKRLKTLTWPALIAGIALAVAAGCESSGSAPTTQDSASSNPIDKMMAPAPHKAGAELWAENCSRCHNIRPPEYYSDAQWETIVHHMRLRADLTGQEARAITDFLKASN